MDRDPFRFISLRSRGNIIRLSRLLTTFGLFELRQVIGLREITARPDLVERGRHQRHPFADEVAGGERLGILGERSDAAALGVAEHHDVPAP